MSRTKCNCHSYNAGVGEVPEVILPINKYFPNTTYPDGQKKETVCVDACIAKDIEDLWKAGIQTLGSCCGHGGRFNCGYPEVILKHAGDAELANLKLSRTGRAWRIFIWVHPQKLTQHRGK